MKKNNIKILIVEDDANLGTILNEYLEAKGYTNVLCTNGQEGYDEFVKGGYAMCILDIMMPLKDGFTLAKEIKAVDFHMPILFLTAKSMKEDVIKGFQIGADDYLTKPFSMEELLMRIKVILRRSNAGTSGEQVFQIGQYVFDYNRQLLKKDPVEQKLTAKETELLRLLAQNKNEIMDRNMALKMIWKDDSYFASRSMDVFIARLRKYLKEDPSIEIINAHGVGFKLVVN